MVSTSAQLRCKATEFLSSKKYANNLADILQMFEVDTDNYSPLLLTIEMIFTEVLKRGDMILKIEPLKPISDSAEHQFITWLQECYEAAWKCVLECMNRGRTSSRLQALVTAMKLLQAEGRYPLEQTVKYQFPAAKLKNIFMVLLDSENSMSALIARFQEYTEYRDVQHYGLKVLPTIAYRKSPTQTYMQNYLELLDKLLTTEIEIEKSQIDRDSEEDKDKVFCNCEGGPQFTYNAASSRRHANRCWGFACQWALCAAERTRRRALLLLVERVLPLLTKPTLATDMLCDSLDAGGPTSMLALQGVLELMRRHNVEYPAVYERLYAMFEPEMFATRYKRRLVHLADVFLSSTHLPESLVAAFAKRLSRLALIASPDDAASLVTLVSSLLHRHPALKRMVCHEDAPAIMSNDPYIMEESSASASRALGSSLWELCALRRHHVAAVAAAAAAAMRATHHAPIGENDLFDAELKRHFKTIELNFIRPRGMSLERGERLLQYWDVVA